MRALRFFVLILAAGYYIGFWGHQVTNHSIQPVTTNVIQSVYPEITTPMRLPIMSKFFSTDQSDERQKAGLVTGIWTGIITSILCIWAMWPMLKQINSTS